MNIVEGSGDNRDMEQKLLDLINHPNTEPHLRDVAQRKLDKLRAQQAEAAQQAAAQADYDAASRQTPALLFQVNVERGFKLEPLPMDDWDSNFVHGDYDGKRKTKYSEVIDVARSLGAFKIDFYPQRSGFVGKHAFIWFHPEDEPEDHLPIEKALKPLKMGVAPNARYYRGGTSAYFISPNKKPERHKR